MAGRASCVSTWARQGSSSLSSLGCGGLPTSEGSYRSRTLGEQLVSLANTQGDPVLLVAAHGPLGQTLCMSGEPTLARKHLQQVVALYEPRQQHALVVRCGYDPGVYAHTMEAWVLWVLGYPTQALQRSHAALTLARAQAHPFTLALTLVTVVILQHMRRQGEATVEHVQAGVVLSTEHGFPYLKVIGTVLQGWELTRGGQVAAGLTQMRAGLASFRLAMGANLTAQPARAARRRLSV